MHKHTATWRTSWTLHPPTHTHTPTYIPIHTQRNPHALCICMHKTNTQNIHNPPHLWPFSFVILSCFNHPAMTVVSIMDLISRNCISGMEPLSYGATMYKPCAPLFRATTAKMGQIRFKDLAFLFKWTVCRIWLLCHVFSLSIFFKTLLLTSLSHVFF